MVVFWKYEVEGNDFAKRIKWSPDGTELIASMESGHLLQFKSLDQELEIKAKLKGHMSGFNDFDWYPWMNSNLSGSDMFLTSSKDLPIQLWSSQEGRVLCTWTAKDQLDQIANCLSVSFSPDGQKVVSGGENKLWMFDINRPGNSAIVDYPTISNKKSRTGQRGLISCINFRFDTSGVLATGSFKGTIGIYDLRSLEHSGPSCCIFDAHNNGVSQIKFLEDGWSIISTGRRDKNLKKWDLRMLQEINIPNEPVTEYIAEGPRTNQRIFFDTLGSKLYMGSQNVMKDFEIGTGENMSSSSFENVVSSVSARKDGILAVSTGTRSFNVNLEDDSDSNESYNNNSLKINSISILKTK